MPLRKLHLLLAITGVLSVSYPRAKAQTFEVATLRPAPNADPTTGSWSPPGIGRFTASHVPLTILIRLAYGIEPGQIVNAPAWLGSDLFDLNAKPADGVALTRDDLKPCLRNLLEQRLGLRAHLETRPTRGYALVIAKSGPHLTPTRGDHFPGFRLNVSPGQMRGLNWSMPTFAHYLTSAAGFPVVDQTGLPGNYDISFAYDPKPDSATATESTLPPLAKALQDATGLALREAKVPTEVLVVDHLNRLPTEN